MEPSVEYEKFDNESGGSPEKPPQQTQPTQPPTQQQPPPAHMPPQYQPQPQFQPIQSQPMMQQVQFQPVQGNFQPMQGQAMAYPVVQYYTHQPVTQVQVPVAQSPQVQICNTSGNSQPPEKWPWCHVVTSVFAFFCCQPFGLIALVMSLLAYADHKVKDYKRSHNKRNAALGFGIASIVIGCLSFIIGIAMTAWIISLASQISNDYQYDNYNNRGSGYDCFGDQYYNSTVWNGTYWACASGVGKIYSPLNLLVPAVLLAFAFIQALF